MDGGLSGAAAMAKTRKKGGGARRGAGVPWAWIASAAVVAIAGWQFSGASSNSTGSTATDTHADSRRASASASAPTPAVSTAPIPDPVVIAPRLLPGGNRSSSWTVPCSAQYAEDADGFQAQCHPGDGKGGGTCHRAVVDNFVTEAEVEQLRSIADRGMSGRPSGAGPTIMDINTGFVRDAHGVENLFEGGGKKGGKNKKPRFSGGDFALYKRVVERIRAAVMKQFGLGDLFFTAPTFITRIVGDPAWRPASVHDEYYHPHVDKNNTAHYDYSGLLYLADHGDDFDGGLFAFLDGDGAIPDAHGCYDHDLKAAGAPHSCAEYARAGYCKKTAQIAEACGKSCGTCVDSDDGGAGRIPGRQEKRVQPARGRLIIFSSGRENVHQVQKVHSGTRLTMSLWFTCDKRKKFNNFLDGKMHATFDGA